MRKLVSFLLLAMFAVTLSACAGVGTKQQEKEMRVKCPACGYEFNVPVHQLNQ